MLGRNLVSCLGSAAILVGFIFLFVPVLGDACGNAFGGDDISISFTSDVSEGICSSARVDRWQFVAPMLLGGIAALLAVANTPKPTKESTDGDVSAASSSTNEG
jgi:hypothetical protein